jgi:hypothetical protein
MKNVIINCRPLALLTLGLILVTSCSKRNRDDDSPSGKLIITIGVSVSSHDIYSNLKAASVGDFKVIIYDAYEAVAASFEKASEMPAEIELPEGTYHAVASYGENQPAAFEEPYYYGISSNFSITAGQTSSLNITCYISNILVSIIYSNTVINDFSDYSTAISNAGGSLTYSKTESRIGYFNAGPLNIAASLYYTDGFGVPQVKTLTGTIANPEPRKHYEIHIDASQNEGSAGIHLIADETVENVIINITENPAFGEIAYGDLLITEIMYNPTALDDALGEWIEVYNASDSTVNLKDLVIRKASGSMHTIASDVVVASHQYAVLARSDTAVISPDYVYSSISLTNTADEIIINKYGTNGSDGLVICSVAYSSALGFPSGVSGSSIQLDISAFNVVSARSGSNWCKSTLAYSTGDLGTPGTTNLSCN